MDPGIMCVENLMLLKPIGKGAFGEIYLSQIKGKQGYLATKKISKLVNNTRINPVMLNI